MERRIAHLSTSLRDEHLQLLFTPLVLFLEHGQALLHPAHLIRCHVPAPPHTLPSDEFRPTRRRKMHTVRSLNTYAPPFASAFQLSPFNPPPTLQTATHHPFQFRHLQAQC